MDPDKSKYPKVPSREIAYAYTVAMHFAQRFEQNLRSILYINHYLEKGESLQLTPEEIWHLKRKEGFIDKPTCEAILKKLRKSAILNGKTVQDALRIFNNACMHRNELAHWFLAEQNFSKITAQREKQIIRELHSMTMDLFKAHQISNALCNQAEYQNDEDNLTDEQILRKLMLEDAHQEVLKQFMTDSIRRGKPKRRSVTGKKR